jgi:hypothetical protein
MWIVVPEHRRRDVALLTEHCITSRYRFASIEQFVAVVRDAATGSAA